MAMRLLVDVPSVQTEVAPTAQLGRSDIISPPTQNVG